MRLYLNGKAFWFSNNIWDDTALRHSFNGLATACFGLSFEEWYRAGYWTGNYRPYALLHGGQVVANASINHICTVWRGTAKHYIQLGTVMTAPAFRRMGLATFLVRRILEEWRHRCDAMYLYANGTALTFYPRFGFVRQEEYRHNLVVPPSSGPVRRLALNRPDDLEVLRAHYAASNPCSALPLVGNWGLVMFHVGSYLQNGVYFMEDLNTVAIAAHEGGAQILYDVYAPVRPPLEEVAARIAKAPKEKVQLGFALQNAPQNTTEKLEQEDTTLFVLADKENLFKKYKTMLPLLSHA